MYYVIVQDILTGFGQFLLRMGVTRNFKIFFLGNRSYYFHRMTQKRHFSGYVEVVNVVDGTLTEKENYCFRADAIDLSYEGARY